MQFFLYLRALQQQLLLQLQIASIVPVKWVVITSTRSLHQRYPYQFTSAFAPVVLRSEWSCAPANCTNDKNSKNQTNGAALMALREIYGPTERTRLRETGENVIKQIFFNWSPTHTSHTEHRRMHTYTIHIRVVLRSPLFSNIFPRFVCQQPLTMRKISPWAKTIISKLEQRRQCKKCTHLGLMRAWSPRWDTFIARYRITLIWMAVKAFRASHKSAGNLNATSMGY